MPQLKQSELSQVKQFIEGKLSDDELGIFVANDINNCSE